MSDKTKSKEVHERALKRYAAAVEADREEAKLASDDLEFLLGDQWPKDVEEKFKAQKRPLHVLNLMHEKIDRVTGAQRQNFPQLKVRPVDDDADPETAEIYDGLIRAIMNNSDGEIIINLSGESSTRCGRGALRALTRYEGPDTFDQEIILEWISDALSVKWDPGAKQYDKQDGDFMFLAEEMTGEKYKEKYPKNSLESWPVDKTSAALRQDWHDGENIIVAEYFEKVTEKHEIVLLEDGRVVLQDEMKEGDVEVRRREAEINKIICYKMNGQEIIEGPKDTNSQYFTIFLVWGKEMVVKGKRHVWGMVRNGKTPQMMINYMASLATETVCSAARAPWLGTSKQIGDYQDLFEAAGRGEAVGLLLHEHDPDFPGKKPMQVQPPPIPSGLEHREEVSKEDLKSTMGVPDANIGAQSKEISGKAIEKRTEQSDQGTFAYPDNLNRTMKTIGRVLVDMISRTYDGTRVSRILGLDGKDERVRFGPRPDGYKHSETKPEDRIYDPTVGKYDVTITVGPNFATRRIETTSFMEKIMRAAPETVPLLLPEMVKTLDFHNADKIAEKCERLLPPELRDNPEGEQLEGVPVEGVPQEAPAEAPVDEGAVVKDAIELAKIKRESMKTAFEVLKLAKEMNLDPERIEEIARRMEG